MPGRLPFANLLCQLCCLALLAPTLGLAQDANPQDAKPKPERIFTSDKSIQATLSGPWASVMRNKKSDQVWPGTFSYEEGGRTVTIPVNISSRGISRQEVCDFPPLRIDFDQAASKGTAFRGAGNLKLVTHCFRSPRYGAYYVKEYLGYLIYNMMTPLSFRVQALDLTYVEPGKDKQDQRFGFLIEDVDDMAKRNGLEKLDIAKTPPSTLDPAATTRFMLFQYLISNLDWAAIGGPKDVCCHNSRLLATAPEALPIFAVPYDLDFSGLVNAHYAAPPIKLKVRSITERLWRGYCAHNAEIPAALEELRALRAPILALFEAEARLTDNERARAIKYLDSFLAELEADPAAVRTELMNKCSGPAQFATKP